MARTRAADDFQAIRARMEELRREREGSNAAAEDRGSVQPARRDNNDLLAVRFHRGYRSIPKKLRSNSEACSFARRAGPEAAMSR
jgi:hypothetical protein